MTDYQWNAFCDFKSVFKKKIEEWLNSAPELPALQKSAAEAAKTPLYPFETAVVYNKDLDKLTKDDDIHLIVIGDNPGKDEQLAKNNRYLVGQAGKLADGFFKKNPQLQTDFRKNVIILNKTPVHSAKTAQLKKMMKDGGKKICELIEESQLWMAEQTAKLHCELCRGGQAASSRTDTSAFPLPEVWLVGYSELKDRGFFIPYKDKLFQTYSQLNPSVWDKVYVFQHFSMNRFTIDLSAYSDEVSLEKIHELGSLHKKEIFSQGERT